MILYIKFIIYSIDVSRQVVFFLKERASKRHRNNLFKFTYVHENLFEFCALINPIQTGSVTSNSLRKALLASNCIPVSTKIKEIIYC